MLSIPIPAFVSSILIAYGIERHGAFLGKAAARSRATLIADINYNYGPHREICILVTFGHAQ
jgi:hypothetical protein